MGGQKKDSQLKLRDGEGSAQECTYITCCDQQVQKWWGGRTKGLIKRKISLFNLETLPVFKLAMLWLAMQLVL